MRRYRVTPNARSPADSGCSLREPCRSAIRPIEASKAAVGYVRFTSTPVVPFAQTAAVPWRCGEWVENRPHCGLSVKALCLRCGKRDSLTFLTPATPSCSRSSSTVPATSAPLTTLSSPCKRSSGSSPLGFGRCRHRGWRRAGSGPRDKRPGSARGRFPAAARNPCRALAIAIASKVTLVLAAASAQVQTETNPNQVRAVRGSHCGRCVS